MTNPKGGKDGPLEEQRQNVSSDGKNKLVIQRHGLPLIQDGKLGEIRVVVLSELVQQICSHCK